MSYRTIKGLKDNEQFAKSIKNLYLAYENDSKISLSDEDTVYLLSVAIILLKAYDLDHSYRSYAEFAYAIILKVSLLTDNFYPLYDFSVNFGFYPVSSMLAGNGLIELTSLTDELSRRYVETAFSHRSVIETHEQHKLREAVIEDAEAKELSLIAPTSYGKSSLIVEDISATADAVKKVAIIVPTKSLLTQTYKMIKKEFATQKIILHDEMYMGDERFIAVLTQERAMRLLLGNPDLSFEKLYIDEAHNLFDKDSRVITLARLIKINRKRDGNSRIIYLSPLISNSDNLKYTLDQDIVEQRIDFNVKEPIYYSYDQSNSLSIYNRFLDIFYPTKSNYTDFLSYIIENSGYKNFIYLYSPKKIERLAKVLSGALEPIDQSPEIDEIIKNLSFHVHEDFYANQYLKKGIVYLHARMPDNIKEYLEHKFSNIHSLKYLIANRVVLEGINLPIDTLFILNTFSLGNKDLTNLIGRVNRLNQIFSKPGRPSLLVPKVHFVNTELYNRSGGKMEQAIRSLRTGLKDDSVKNPLLYEFDISQYHPERDKAKIAEAKKVIEEESVLESDATDPIEKLRKDLVETGLGTIFNLSPLLCETIYGRLTSNVETEDIIEVIYSVFVKDLSDYILDNEFGRLSSEETRNYYKKFIVNMYSQPFKKNINKQVAAFAARVKDPERGNTVYLGEKLGEQPAVGGFKNLFVDLTNKTRPELVNLAIAKFKVESDFVNYKLIMTIQLLFKYDVISSDLYNHIVYGTADQNKINFIRLGLSLNILNKLETDNQLANFSISHVNQIIANTEFDEYKKGLDDITLYEINKVL